ncbi:MAG: ABC transporter permease, partial [Chloroflexota bacterium]
MMAGLLQSANIAFVIAISVEIISARQGLGVLLWFGWQTFRVSELYAVLAVISVIGVGLNYLFSWLTRALVPWMGE